MSKAISTPNQEEMQKGLKLLGLNLSEIEFKEFQSGRVISLEERSLGEIGSVFILAAAMSTKNICRQKKRIVTFQDLPSVMPDFDDTISGTTISCSGLPIYCWKDDRHNKCCIYLTLVNRHPAVHYCAIQPIVSQLSQASDKITTQSYRTDPEQTRVSHLLSPSATRSQNKS